MPSDSHRRPAVTTITKPHADRDMARPLPSALSWIVLVAFVAGLGVAILVFDAPIWFAIVYGAMSVIAFAVYGFDKSAAGRTARRVPESTLLTLGLVCGWPGALVAQQLFRHKTRKRSFRRLFWLSVLVNVLVLAVVIAFIFPL